MIGITELQGTGYIDTVTSGNITLTEVTGFGPMRIGTVASTVGDVQLTVPDTPNPGDDLLIMPDGQITAPGGILPPSYSAPQVAATVNPTGGNTPAVNPSGTGPATVSGYLAPGTYYVVYTFTFPNGSRDARQPGLVAVHGDGGQDPAAHAAAASRRCDRLQHLPVQSVCDPGLGDPLRRAACTVSAFNLLNAAPQGGAAPPATNPLIGRPTVTPTVSPTGGGASGGTLTPGTYFVFYTSVNASGNQSPPSPSSSIFTVSAGNIPQVTLPPLPLRRRRATTFTSPTRPRSRARRCCGSRASPRRSSTSTADPPNGNVALPVNNVASPPPIVVVNNNSMYNNNNTHMDCNCGSMMSGGGSGSGSTFLTGLASGTYYVVYTFTYISDAETFASQPSNTFTIGQGQLATVILPPLPPGASGINLYVSANGAPPTRYYTGVTETNLHPVSGPPQTLFNMIFPYAPGGATPPAYNLNPITPKVNVIGGNAYGGNLLPGTYYLYYTFTYPNGVQSTRQPGFGELHGCAGQHPAGFAADACPQARRATTSICPTRWRTRARRRLYASGVTTTTYNLQRNALSGATVPPALNFPTAAPTVAPAGGGTTGGRWHRALISSLTRSSTRRGPRRTQARTRRHSR